MVRAPAITVICAAIALLAAACQGGVTTARSAAHSSSSHSSSVRVSPAAQSVPASTPQLKITPGSGAAADPSAGITVTASRGTITGISVRTAGEPVSGTLNAAKTVWHSQWALDVSQSYTIAATATGAGKTVTRTASFRTLSPVQTFTTEIIEGNQQTYGVGIPIVLYFSHQITDKAAVERALQIRAAKPVIGAWYWDDSCGMAPTCAYFRPRDYWPANTTVTFTGHLDGVEGAPGVYGYHTLSQTFTIGDSLIVTASTRSHFMNLYRNGHLIDHWPISTGRPGDDTPDGTYVTIDKGNPVDMVGPGYNIEVPWSVRITWSSDYLHDAYWSVGEQGFTNVSHGCVNMPPADAEAYYNMEVPGDPVTISGSPRGGAWDNGWTQWFLPWSQYLKGSALHMAVQAGPDGSTFVDPATLPASTATAPLGTSAPGNPNT
ncbi:MAG TPA: Ig-like domain-containing protein [Streptosporangiaceae bacterium]